MMACIWPLPWIPTTTYSTLSFSWYREQFELMRVKAPLVWVAGQFFIPVGKLMGSARAGLLLMNVVLFAGAIVLLYNVVLQLFQRKLLALIAALFLIGSPLLNHMASEFWREVLQLLIIVLCHLCGDQFQEMELS